MTCRGASGICDVAESCSGTSATCSADTFLSTSTVCRASAGVCDVAETCSGTAAACPADAFASTSTVCRTATGECDAVDFCEGTAACADHFLVGQSCTDEGDACTPDVCNASGVCEHTDSDADTSWNLCDNCSGVFNPDQQNSDCIDPLFPLSQCGSAAPELAGCCDGGDLCDECPAQNDNQNCDPDASGATVIDSGGGTLETADGSTTIDVPAGALSAETSISVTENGPVDHFTLGDGLVVSVSARPTGQHFDVPVVVTLGWNDRDGDEAVDLGTCSGGLDDTQACDSNSDCTSGNCSATGVLAENDLVLRRNNDPFSHAGFGAGPFACSDHLSGACATALADCGDPAGTAQSTVAGCCSHSSNSWTFQTCSFSEYSLGDPAAAMIPGRGKAETDCIAEWVVDNALNVPATDRKGFPNSNQRCTDGDSSCDQDGSANGACVLRVGLCMNVADQRLIDKKTGAVACTATTVAQWEATRPRPDSDETIEAANAISLRNAIAAIAATTVSGQHAQIVSFSPALGGSNVCTELVPITVPLKDAATSGKAVLKARTTDAAGTIDADLLKLRCDPAP